MARLNISYTGLHEAGKDMKQIVSDYAKAQRYIIPYGDHGAMAPIDNTPLVPDDYVTALGDHDLMTGVGTLLGLWRQPLSMSLGTMRTAGEYFEKVADAYFSADAKVVSSLATSGYGPIDYPGGFSQYQQAHDRWLAQEKERLKYEPKIEAWHRDHPGEPLPDDLRAHEHEGRIAQYDANGNIIGWVVPDEPLPPGIPPIGAGTVVVRDAGGRPTSVTNGNVTSTITYDAAGHPLSIVSTDPNRTVTTTTHYNDKGEPTEVAATVTDKASGQTFTTTTTYTDAWHYRTVEVGPDGGRTSTSVVVTGNPVASHTAVATTTDPEGKVSTATTTVTITPGPDDLHENVTETTVYSDGTAKQSHSYVRPSHTPSYEQLYRH